MDALLNWDDRAFGMNDYLMRYWATGQGIKDLSHDAKLALIGKPAWEERWLLRFGEHCRQIGALFHQSGVGDDAFVQAIKKLNVEGRRLFEIGKIASTYAYSFPKDQGRVQGISIPFQMEGAYIHALLLASGGTITKETYHFLTAGHSHAAWGDDEVDYAQLPTKDQMKLAYAFMDQMKQEAIQAQRPPVVGHYVLMPPHFHTLSVDFDHILLALQPDGIWFALVRPNSVSYGFWCVDYDNITLHFSEIMAWEMRIFMAAIWRDACIVQERMWSRQNKWHWGQGKGERMPKEKRLLLPRSIVRAKWGTEEDQSTISHQVDGRNVRGHYRQLPDDHQPSEKAIQNAERFGYPPPPEGFTFVQPYTWGIGGDGEIERVVCRGLQTAAIALSRIGEES